MSTADRKNSVCSRDARLRMVPHMAGLVHAGSAFSKKGVQGPSSWARDATGRAHEHAAQAGFFDIQAAANGAGFFGAGGVFEVEGQGREHGFRRHLSPWPVPVCQRLEGTRRPSGTTGSYDAVEQDATRRHEKLNATKTNSGAISA
jgi:hypothetical protein